MWLPIASVWASGEPRDPYPNITGSFVDSVEGELESAHLSILGIEVWSGTLQDANRILGHAKTIRAGRREFLCYLSSDPADSTAIIFESNQLGGPEKTITLIVVAQKSNIARHRERCTTSDNIHHDLSTASGIKLSMAMSRLESLLGPPAHRDNDHFIYRYLRKSRLTDAELAELEMALPNAREYPYADVTTRLEANFRDGQLAWFLIHKVETY